jgi:serine/threonine protein kinase
MICDTQTDSFLARHSSELLARWTRLRQDCASLSTGEFCRAHPELVEGLLNVLLAKWESAREEGCSISVAECCVQCPELTPPLQARVAALERMGLLLNAPTHATLESTQHAFEEVLPRQNLPAEPAFVGKRYRPLRHLASGGLGDVFVAWDEELGREVALKRLQPRFAHSPQARQGFLREAEITSRLEHPGIVAVHGAGEDGTGQPFYTMRLIRGETLQKAIDCFHQAETPHRSLAERRRDLHQLLHCFIAVCNSVAYAHDRGILHRDLKPGNIMLGPYGETLVVDWGLARESAVGSRQSAVGSKEELGDLLPSADCFPRTADCRLPEADTHVGDVVGTVGFMSPEQAAGREDLLSPASDIFSLGATLYVLLTGRTAFRLGEPDKALRGEFPAPSELKKGIPPALEKICLKAMAADPQQRYQSPLELACDLERWLSDKPGSAWHDPWPVRMRRWLSKHRNLVASAITLLLLSVVSLAWSSVLSAAHREYEEQTRQTAQTAQKQRWQAVDRALAPADHRLEYGHIVTVVSEVYRHPDQAVFWEKLRWHYDQKLAAAPGASRAELRQRAKDLRRRGYLHLLLGYFEMSEVDFRRALRIYQEQLKDSLLPEDRREWAITANNLGVVLHLAEKRHQAVQVYLQAEKIVAELLATGLNQSENTIFLIDIRQNRAKVLLELGRKPEVQHLLDENVDRLESALPGHKPLQRTALGGAGKQQPRLT